MGLDLVVFGKSYCIQAPKSIARRAYLLDPESVKGFLAAASFSEAELVEDIDRFYIWKRIPFQKPNYRRIDRLSFIPLESEIDQLISGVGKNTATFIQLLKETGMRPAEAWNLRWTDINTKRLTVDILPLVISVERGFPEAIGTVMSDVK